MKRLARGLKSLPPGLYFVLLALVVLVALWEVPRWQIAAFQGTSAEQFKTEDDFRKTWATIALGLLVLVAGYTGWRTFLISREGQITDRFNKAIDHLGSDKLEIRLGGIYALERIGEDSPTHHWQVMEVLAAFVRERTLYEKAEAKPDQADGEGRRGSSLTEASMLPTDIQAVLTVIGRRSTTFEKREQRLDLRSTNLRDADLSRADLRGANLSRADLRGANLSSAPLNNALLKKADLRNANLRNANLSGAYLAEANLSNADLSNADLRYALLWEADLSNADLINADLSVADLSGAHLSGTRLVRTRLSRAKLRRANLRLARLWEADLREADLRDADLGGAKYNEITKWPYRFDPIAAGAINNEEP